MKGQNAVTVITGISIAVIVAVIILVPLADTVNRATSSQSVVNETVTCADGSDWVAGTSNATLTYDNLLPGTTASNDTKTLTYGTEFVTVNATGIISFSQCNTSASNTTWNVSYSYYDDIYQTSSMTRTVTTYVSVISAAVIIAAGAAVIAKVA